MALGADLWRLRRLQSDLQAAGLVVVSSYVSLTEVSEYAAGLPDEMKQTRLHPSLPPEGMTAFCFYPMSKRRGDAVGSNWFSMPFEERKALMHGHGAVGRTFAGRALMLPTVSWQGGWRNAAFASSSFTTWAGITTAICRAPSADSATTPIRPRPR